MHRRVQNSILTQLYEGTFPATRAHLAPRRGPKIGTFFTVLFLIFVFVVCCCLFLLHTFPDYLLIAGNVHFGPPAHNRNVPIPQLEGGPLSKPRFLRSGNPPTPSGHGPAPTTLCPDNENPRPPPYPGNKLKKTPPGS